MLKAPMKQLIRLTIIACACGAWSLTGVAGPEPLPSGKEMKQVAPAPAPECTWTGFYIGLHAGGQFGHSQTGEDFTIEGLGTAPGPKFGYSESGFVGGGQVGYNYQWNWLVLGIEADFGYMNLDGDGHPEFVESSENDLVTGSTDSDFYTTVRGRLGVAFGRWLFYGTGGGIGLNYETRYLLDDRPFGGPLVSSGTTDFNWGYVFGGGIEHQFMNCRWSLKLEYLYFEVDPQDFDKSFELEPTMSVGTIVAPAQSLVGVTGHFSGETFGHIIRVGLNYHF